MNALRKLWSTYTPAFFAHDTFERNDKISSSSILQRGMHKSFRIFNGYKRLWWLDFCVGNNLADDADWLQYICLCQFLFRNMVHGSSVENGEHEFGMPLLLVLLYVYDGIFLTLTSWMNPNFGINFMNLI
ncbi:hypothetical protein DM860_010050 [Cuscuta australis]|uniref:Uncharacterized protein n=1 Tax=Cuscuta australis TaxID=267555 RepID=A0A328D6S7_9ASTE|nr:hypothetical protein DM860_010050 [Cuscuta australis]